MSTAVPTSIQFPSVPAYEPRLNAMASVVRLCRSLAGFGKCGVGNYTPFLTLFWPVVRNQTSFLTSLTNIVRPVFEKPRRGPKRVWTPENVRYALEKVAGPFFIRDFDEPAILSRWYSKTILVGKYPAEISMSPESYTVLQCPQFTEAALTRFMVDPHANATEDLKTALLPLSFKLAYIAWCLVAARNEKPFSFQRYGLSYTSEGYIYINWRLFRWHPAIEPLVPGLTPEEICRLLEKSYPTMQKALIERDQQVSAFKLRKSMSEKISVRILPLYLRLCHAMPSSRLSVDLPEGASEPVVVVDPCTVLDPTVMADHLTTWFNGEWHRLRIEQRELVRKKNLVTRRLAEAVSQLDPHISPEIRETCLAELRNKAIEATIVETRMPRLQKVTFRPCDWLKEIIDSDTGNARNARNARNASNSSQKQTPFLWFSEDLQETLYAIRYLNQYYFALSPTFYTDAFCVFGEKALWDRLTDGLRLQMGLGVDAFEAPAETKSSYVARMAEEIRRNLALELFGWSLKTGNALESPDAQADPATPALLASYRANESSLKRFYDHPLFKATLSERVRAAAPTQCVSGSAFQQCRFLLYQLQLKRGHLMKRVYTVLPDYDPEPRTYTFFSQRVLTGVFEMALRSMPAGQYRWVDDYVRQDTLSRTFPLVHAYMTQDLTPAPYLLAWSRFCKHLDRKGIPKPNYEAQRRWSPLQDLNLVLHRNRYVHRMSPEQWVVLDNLLAPHGRHSFAARFKVLVAALRPLVHRKWSYDVMPHAAYQNRAKACRTVLLYGLLQQPFFKRQPQAWQSSHLPVARLAMLPDSVFVGLSLPETYSDPFFTALFNDLNRALDPLNRTSISKSVSATQQTS